METFENSELTCLLEKTGKYGEFSGNDKFASVAQDAVYKAVQSALYNQVLTVSQGVPERGVSSKASSSGKGNYYKLLYKRAVFTRSVQS